MMAKMHRMTMLIHFTQAYKISINITALLFIMKCHLIDLIAQISSHCIPSFDINNYNYN